MLTRDQVLSRLQAHREALQTRYQLRSLSVFGSTARDERRQDSDVDVLVEFGTTPSFAAYVGLKRELEALLGCSVDLVTESGLKPRAKAAVMRDLVRVAGRTALRR